MISQMASFEERIFVKTEGILMFSTVIMSKSVQNRSNRNIKVYECKVNYLGSDAVLLISIT